MFSKEDFLSMLQDGVTPEEIAEAMTRELNAAIQENEAAVAASAKEEKLNELAETFLHAMSDYVKLTDPDALTEELDKLTIADVREVLDESLKIAKSLKEGGLLDLFTAETFPMPFVPPMPKVKEEEKAKPIQKSDDDEIGAFFDLFGLR